MNFQEYKPKLIEAHKEGSKIIENDNCIPEPLETAICVEEHRWFWKPEIVKFILVAESHVYTNKNEIQVKIDLNRLPNYVPKNIPLCFVRFVYCLSYGNSCLLSEPERIEYNRGSNQYVNLFAKCVGLDKKPEKMKRLKWKVKVLKTISKRGIWLLDASLHACYYGKNRQTYMQENNERKDSNRLPSKIVEKIIPISWRQYVKPIIDGIPIDEKCVWMVGKTLHDTLSSKCGWNSDMWIYQPNVRFQKNSEYYGEKRRRESELIKSIGKYCQA